MLTNKGKYGLKAMLHLARLDDGETDQVAEITQTNKIPKKFLDAILLDLRNAGMLKRKKGPGGGYALAKPAGTIKVGAVIRALDGPLAPIACASQSAFRACDDCGKIELRPVRLIMSDVCDAMASVVDNTTIADLAKRTPSRFRHQGAELT